MPDSPVPKEPRRWVLAPTTHDHLLSIKEGGKPPATIEKFTVVESSYAEGLQERIDELEAAQGLSFETVATIRDSWLTELGASETERDEWKQRAETAEASANEMFDAVFKQEARVRVLEEALRSALGTLASLALLFDTAGFEDRVPQYLRTDLEAVIGRARRLLDSKLMGGGPDASPEPTQAPRAEADGAMLGRLGVDGAEWARQFMVVNGGFRLATDDDLMRGWFANAIEAGRSAGYMEAVKNPAEAEIVRKACEGPNAQEAGPNPVRWDYDAGHPIEPDPPEDDLRERVAKARWAAGQMLAAAVKANEEQQEFGWFLVHDTLDGLLDGEERCAPLAVEDEGEPANDYPGDCRDCWHALASTGGQEVCSRHADSPPPPLAQGVEDGPEVDDGSLREVVHADEDGDKLVLVRLGDPDPKTDCYGLGVNAEKGNTYAWIGDSASEAAQTVRAIADRIEPPKPFPARVEPVSATSEPERKPQFSAPGVVVITFDDQGYPQFDGATMRPDLAGATVTLPLPTPLSPSPSYDLKAEQNDQ